MNLFHGIKRPPIFFSGECFGDEEEGRWYFRTQGSFTSVDIAVYWTVCVGGGRVGGNPNLGRSVLVCTKAAAFAAKLLKAHFVFSFDS